MNARRDQLLAEAGLVFITFLWGLTFVLVKSLLESLPVHLLNAARFGVAAASMWALAALRARVKGRAAPGEGRGRLVVAGCSLGMLLFAIYECQTHGLQTTTASKSAFITGTSVVWTPLLAAAFLGRRPSRGGLAAALLGLAGLALLVRGGGGAPGGAPVIGDAWTVGAAIAISAHLILTKRLSPRFSTTYLAAVQLTWVAILNVGIAAASGEQPIEPLTPHAVAGLLFLGVVATGFAFWGQTRLQRYTSEERTAIVLLFEPVFGALTAWIVLGEMFHGAQFAGAALILIAAVGPLMRWRLRNAGGHAGGNGIDSE